MIHFLISWQPPAAIARWSHEKCTEIRKNYHIIVEGDNVPPPIPSFKGYLVLD